MIEIKKTFGQAIIALKAGKRVSREGWNGKGMFVFKQIPALIPAEVVPKMTSLPQTVKDWFASKDFGPSYRNQFALVDASGNVDSWSPSGSDALADDWCIFHPEPSEVAALAAAQRLEHPTEEAK